MPHRSMGEIGVVSRYDFRAKEYGQLDKETGFFECLR